MSINMRKLILFLFINLFSIYCFSQKVYNSDYDTKVLEGTWVAISGNKSYEITFVKQIVYAEPIKASMEVVIGSMKYWENNKIIKNVNLDGFESPINAYFRGLNKFKLHYREKDNGKEIFGMVYFDINPDGKTARWYNLFKRQIPVSTKDTFDIPKELTFTKK